MELYESIPNTENRPLCYPGCPNRLVYEDEGYAEDMGEDAMELLYPDLDEFRDNFEKYAYRNLSTDTLNMINELWEELKIN